MKQELKEDMMAKWLDRGGISTRQMIDIPPVWLVGALTLVWVQARMMPFGTMPFGPPRVLGGLLAGTGIGVALWAAMAFRAHMTSVVPHQVPRIMITTGLFKFSRNPIYLGDVMVLLGAVFWFGAWPSLGVVAGFIWVLTVRFIRPEEARLQQYFGAAFSAYTSTTRRWI